MKHTDPALAYMPGYEIPLSKRERVELFGAWIHAAVAFIPIAFIYARVEDSWNFLGVALALYGAWIVWPIIALCDRKIRRGSIIFKQCLVFYVSVLPAAPILYIGILWTLWGFAP